MQDYTKEYENICGEFGIEPVNIEPYGEGHINNTMMVTTTGKRYILQRINNSIFKSPDNVMHNIYYVTKYLAEKGVETLHIILTKDEKPYYKSDAGYFRMYDFIENTVTYQETPSPEVMNVAGRAFGDFQNSLSGFDTTLLKEIIPDFHNTPKRYENFEKAVSADSFGRLSSCEDEVNFVKDRKDTFSKVTDALDKKEIPERITHNDTKLNNILLDRDTNKARAIIDLDTVMPGSMLYDFGDSIRFGASTAAEDEKDLDKVHFDIELFKAYAEGYVDALRENITEKELNLLPYSAYLMTMECGMRFLTDYLENDVYFKTAYSDHNLVRCRTQFKLASEMEKQFDEMLKICKNAL